MKTPTLKDKPKHHKTVGKLKRATDRLTLTKLTKHLIKNTTHT
jgi:hypothetical protein